MSTSQFERYSEVIRTMSESALSSLDSRLLMEQQGNLQIYYAPFDHSNPKARIVLVGLTPGRTQMINALREARFQLQANANGKETLRAAKKTASFSGAMRPNLISLLDAVGLHGWLGLRSCADLFAHASDLVQTASVLRYPVFVGGENYSGNPDPLSHPLLKRYVLEYFAKEAQGLSQAVFVPLGDKAGKVLQYLGAEGVVDKARIIDGLPHPSGANAERIAYFLGQKPRERLSVKTNASKLDCAKRLLVERVSALPN